MSARHWMTTFTLTALVAGASLALHGQSPRAQTRRAAGRMRRGEAGARRSA